MATRVGSNASIGGQSKNEQRLEASLTKALEKIKQLESENKALKEQFAVSGETSTLGSTEEEWKEQRDSYVSRTLLAEQELKLVKALLLLQNVNVKVNLNDGSRPMEVLVAGDANLLEKLMKLRKQVRFLKQQILVIRAQVLQLTIAIPQTVSWVQKSAHTAIESHAQQRRDLQNRLSRLKSVLKS